LALLGALASMEGSAGAEPEASAQSTPADPGDAAELARAARAEVEAASAALASAEAELRRIDGRQAALEAEILALKRRGDRSERLAARLRASIAAERALEAALAALDEARAELEQTARRQVRVLDAELRRRARGLKQGTDRDRRAAAAIIRSLLESRAWILEAARRAEPPAAEVARDGGLGLPMVEPLDGPRELREKADFAEDARDKLRAKRARLMKLVESRRRTRAIARAARDFAVDVSLFDEELRSAAAPGDAVAQRDERAGGSGSGGTPASGAGADAPDDLATDGSGGDIEMPNPGMPPNFGSGEAGEPRQSGGGEGGGLDGPTTPGGSQSPPIPAGPSESAGDVSARSVDPVVLLSLKVDDLAAEGVGVEDLEQLLAEYERVEALFSARARAMRARARRLDEAPPDE
jgi:hypothetical protein